MSPDLVSPTRAVSQRARTKATRGFGLGIVLAVLAVLLAVAPGTGGALTPHVVVSLTFDDGRADQYAARQPLRDHGMHATFYVNSGGVGSTSWYMTWSQLNDLASDGNEIGGHTLTHQDLTTLTPAEQVHEACDDRAELLSRGFAPVLSFAYPYASLDFLLQLQGTTQLAVQSCGYTSARAVMGIRSSNCADCPFAETIPPADRLAIRTPHDVRTFTTLADMEGYVTQAEANGGGWVVFVFHSLCDGCEEYSTTLSQFTAFLDWLQPRSASGTVVRTVGEVMTQQGAL